MSFRPVRGRSSTVASSRTRSSYFCSRSIRISALPSSSFTSPTSPTRMPGHAHGLALARGHAARVLRLDPHLERLLLDQREAQPLVGRGCSRRCRRASATMPRIAAKSRRCARDRAPHRSAPACTMLAVGVALQAHPLELHPLAHAPPDERVEGGQALAGAGGVLAQPAVLLAAAPSGASRWPAAAGWTPSRWSSCPAGRRPRSGSGGSWVSHGMSGRNFGAVVGPRRAHALEREVELARRSSSPASPVESSVVAPAPACVRK